MCKTYCKIRQNVLESVKSWAQSLVNVDAQETPRVAAKNSSSVPRLLVMQARLWNMSKPFLARINREMQNNLQQIGAFKKIKVKKKNCASRFSWTIFLQVNLFQKLFFLQNMGRTCCVQKLFWMSETISVYNMLSPCLSLEFSCIELVIQWTICLHIVG